MNEQKRLYTAEGHLAKKLDVIDPNVIRNLSAKGMTQVEVARVLGISVDSLQRHFIKEYYEGRDNLVQRLREKQIEVAMLGSEKMLTHLGKYYLGQTDTVEDESKQRPKIELAFAPRTPIPSLESLQAEESQESESVEGQDGSKV